MDGLSQNEEPSISAWLQSNSNSNNVYKLTFRTSDNALTLLDVTDMLYIRDQTVAGGIHHEKVWICSCEFKGSE